MADRALRFLSTVTHCVNDLDIAESAWSDFLGYSTVAAGTLDQDVCAVWDTPSAIGQRFCLMRPASGEPVYIRFIETQEPNTVGPPASWGWCATELLVKNPDELAERLLDSPFRRLAGPHNLFPGARSARAMQMLGPSGELIYFTRILPGGSRYGMKGARSDVDRAFIVPVGGPSMQAMHGFYGGKLGLRTFEPMAFRNGILAWLCGVDQSTIFPTSIAPIPGRRFLIEMDELPPTTGPRPCRDGHLPPGIAMISCETKNLDASGFQFRAAPRPLQGTPYNGRRVATISGPAGEWIELIETG
jgi:hypothetical protein